MFLVLILSDFFLKDMQWYQPIWIMRSWITLLNRFSLVDSNNMFYDLKVIDSNKIFSLGAMNQCLKCWFTDSGFSVLKITMWLHIWVACHAPEVSEMSNWNFWCLKVTYSLVVALLPWVWQSLPIKNDDSFFKKGYSYFLILDGPVSHNWSRIE